MHLGRSALGSIHIIHRLICHNTYICVLYLQTNSFGIG